MTYPAQQAPPAAEREVHAQLQGVEQRTGGWMRFLLLEQGKQYPLKVDTKKPEVINAAMALMGQWVTAVVNEQQSTNINPNNNQPYINRYLNQIAAYGTSPGVMPNAAQQAAGVPAGTQLPPASQPLPPTLPPGTIPAAAVPQPASMPQPGISGFDKDMNIMRQTASKVAATLIASGKIDAGDNPAVTLVEVCEGLLAYYVHGPLRFGVQAFGHHQAGAPQPALPQAPSPIPTGDPPPEWGGGQQQPTLYNDPGPQDGQVDSLAQ